jgi:SAM-dependent methyltransferase
VACPPDDCLLTLTRFLRAQGFQSVAVTPETHRRVNGRPENHSARDLVGIFGWSRPFNPATIGTDLFEVMRAAEALIEDERGLRSRYRVSTLRDLAFLHSAYPTEDLDAVFFGPDTYRFIDAVKQELMVTGHVWSRAVDIGCGAGPAGILLARENPCAEVLMTDINPAAVRLSRINAAVASTLNISVHETSLLDGLDGEFDLIVANPPYLMDSAHRLYRHGGGKRGEGLSLAILETALTRLKSGGRLLLYSGSGIVDGIDYFRRQIATRLAGANHKWSYREIDPDIFGEELDTFKVDRIAAVFLSLIKA